MYKPGVIRRRMTGIGLGVLFLLMWFLQGWPMRIVLGILGVIGVLEVYSALEHRGAKPVKWVGVGAAVLMVPVMHWAGLAGLFLLSSVAVAVGMCAVMLRAEIEGDSLLATLFPVFYPGMLFGFLLAPTYIDSRLTASVVIGLIYFTAICNDVAAYEIGSLYGKQLLAPKLSPKKTREGSAAGLIGSVAISILLPLAMKLLCVLVPALQGLAEEFPPIWICALYGAVVGVAGQLGDLCASMVKRSCGVKDYGTIFPGHGGVMDRLDSVLFNGLCAAVFMAVFSVI